MIGQKRAEPEPEEPLDEASTIGNAMAKWGMTMPPKNKKSKYDVIQKTMSIDIRHRARVNGKRGRKLLQLTAQSGCKLTLRGNDTAERNTVVFDGMRWQVKKAMALVKELITPPGMRNSKNKKGGIKKKK